MPDPIQGVNITIPVGVSNTGQTGAAQSTDQATAQAAVVTPAATDEADVGQTQALLAQIIQVANATPAVDDARVNALQQSIANGTYQVDSMAIARKLLGAGGDDE